MGTQQDLADTVTAVVGLAKAMANELARRNIRVNTAIRPA